MSAIQADLRDQSISSRIIQSLLMEEGFREKDQLKNPHYKKGTRLLIAYRHLNWTAKLWVKVRFSDEVEATALCLFTKLK